MCVLTNTLARTNPESEIDLQFTFTGLVFECKLLGEIIKMNQTLQLTIFSIEVPMCRLSEKDVVVVGADI